MNETSSIIPYLFSITFILVLAIGVWQYRRVTKAKREHHQSAQARAQGDRPGRVGTEGEANEGNAR
jgi:cytochrome oxidase assembly protein ShyY1